LVSYRSADKGPQFCEYTWLPWASADTSTSSELAVRPKAEAVRATRRALGGEAGANGADGVGAGWLGEGLMMLRALMMELAAAVLVAFSAME
jgi:hypothetical protein